MVAELTPLIKTRIEEIKEVYVPKDLSQRAQLWIMANDGEIVKHSTVIRAIARYDILESPYMIPTLYQEHQHLIRGYDDNDDEYKVTLLMAVLTMAQIASFMGY